MSINPSSQATYRCPGCGEEVNKNVLGQVLAHHEHVLQRRSVGFAPAAMSERERQAARREARSQDAPQRAAAANAAWRRYGHDTNSAR